MSEYDQMRVKTQQLSDGMSENHPCQAGNGNCCEQLDIAMVRGDYFLILEAIESGEIDKSVIKKAVENASDLARTFCPFFDLENRSCTIYKFRPLACMSFGAATDMCESCRDCLAISGYIPQIQDMQILDTIEYYIESQEPQAIVGVVRNNLAKLI